MSRQDLEALFLSHLPKTEQILGALARRRGLSPDAAEEFSAWAKLRLIENDYAILAKFRGESSLTTYLSVVLAMLLREYHSAEWGRWRSSAAARRQGPLGIRLETLVNRDGIALAVAGNMLRSAGDTALSDKELAAIASTFPRRTSLKPSTSNTPLLYVESAERTDRSVVDEEVGIEQAATRKALGEALDTLAEEDRLLVRLHYMEAMSVADIARALCVPQKPLYPRIRSALAILRKTLERAGVSPELIREWAADPP